jgi:hypothetical protein
MFDGTVLAMGVGTTEREAMLKVIAKLTEENARLRSASDQWATPEEVMRISRKAYEAGRDEGIKLGAASPCGHEPATGSALTAHARDDERATWLYPQLGPKSHLSRSDLLRLFAEVRADERDALARGRRRQTY